MPTLPDSDAVEEIVSIVEDFRRAEVAMYSEPQPPYLARPELSVYLADPLLSRVLATLNDMWQAGILFEGELVWMPTVTELRMDDTPPTAVVRDCIDASSWKSVFHNSGEPVPGDSRPDEYVAWLRVKQYPEGWLVYDSDVEDDARC